MILLPAPKYAGSISGSGKTRVLENAPLVSKLGFKIRSNGATSDLPCPDNPLAIVCCPLSAIIEDKIRDQSNSGMLSMYGGCKSSLQSSGVKMSTSEDLFLSDKLAFIYGHPESFTTELGKTVLESNESRICIYATDEVGFNIWGEHFRILMSSVPGAIRVFSSSAPMLCMSATVGKMEQKKILDDLGMSNRTHQVIESNPIKDHLFISKLKRPSNKKCFLKLEV